MNIINITDESITEYIHEFYKPLNKSINDLRIIGEKGNIPIIQKETEMLLGTILSLKKPKKILEIGTAIGYSSIYFATKCEDAKVYTIEHDEYAFKAAKHNIKIAGFDNRIFPFLGDGQEQIEKLEDKGVKNFDVVFIDAAKSHYKRFLESALRVCNKDALIISDNVLQRGMTANDKFDIHDKHKTNIKKMREYVQFIFNHKDMESSLMAVGDGLALTLLRGENE